MDFDSRVAFLRKHQNFMVVPLSDVRAIAYAAQEKQEAEEEDFILGKTENGVLTLTQDDIQKIIRNYPDLKDKLK